MTPSEYLLTCKSTNEFRLYALDDVVMDYARGNVYQAKGISNEFAGRFQGLSLGKFADAVQSQSLFPVGAKIVRQSNVLYIPVHKNFYHMLIDALPRLWGCFSTDLPVFMCKDWINLYPKLLSLLQTWLPPREWIFVDAQPHPTLGFSTPLLPGRLVGNNINMFSNAADNISIAFRNNKRLAVAFWQRWYQEHYEQQPRVRNIFLARGKAAKNSIRCINQEEIFQSIREYGFEWVDPMDYEFTDLAKLLNGADTVVGVHGAGLSNTVFMQPGAKFVQLANSSGSDLIYQLLAKTNKSQYRVIYGCNQNNEPVIFNQGKFTVDPNSVIAALEHIDN